MGCVCSESRSSNRVYAITPSLPLNTSAALAVPVLGGAERPEDAPPLLSQPKTAIPIAMEPTPLGDQSELLDTDAEVRAAIEKGSAAQLEAVLSRKQLSGEHLREEPFCSMMYRAA
eukprot:RCo015132